jgi:hypothetical protein
MYGGKERGARRRRRKRRSNLDKALRSWAQDDAPTGDEKEERGVGIVVVGVIVLIVAACLYYIFGHLEYEAPF